MTAAWVPSAAAQDRTDWRRRRQLKSVLAAVGVALLLIVPTVWGVAQSVGWQRTANSFFNAELAQRAFPRILEGLWLNVRVWVLASLISLALGWSLALLRTTATAVLAPVRAAVAAYVDIFRGLPLLLVLILVGFGLPSLRIPGTPMSAAVLGSIAIVLCYTAYLTEIFRSGMEAVPAQQILAARALGMTRTQTALRVISPQGSRTVIPALTGTVIALQKDSGLISILGAIEATRAAQLVSATSFTFTPYVLAGILFFLLSLPLTRFADWLTRRNGMARAARAARRVR